MVKTIYTIKEDFEEPFDDDVITEDDLSDEESGEWFNCLSFSFLFLIKKLITML